MNLPNGGMVPRPHTGAPLALRTTMNPERRQTLNRILRWVGYGLAYSADEEEAQAHWARQPDEDIATEKRSVGVWVAADDTRGLSYQQLRTRLDRVLAKTDGLRSATRNILDATADRLPSVGSLQPRTAALLTPLSEVPQRVSATVKETREKIAVFRRRVADRLEPVARLPKQVGVVGPAHGVDSTADANGENQVAALLGPVVVPSDEQNETGSRLSSAAADGHADGNSQNVEELQATAESRLAAELAKSRAEADERRAEAEERQHQDLARVREETERAYAAELEQARLEAAQLHAEEMARVQAEAERLREQAHQEARAAAEVELGVVAQIETARLRSQPPLPHRPIA